MNADGTDSVRVTQHGDFDDFPDWHPSALLRAFTKKGPDGGPFVLFLGEAGSVGRGSDRNGRAAILGTYWLGEKLLKLLALQRLNLD